MRVCSRANTGNFLYGFHTDNLMEIRAADRAAFLCLSFARSGIKWTGLKNHDTACPDQHRFLPQMLRDHVHYQRIFPIRIFIF